MREKAIAIGCTLILLVATAIAKWQYAHPLSAELRYYFAAFFLSGAILVVIWSAGWFRSWKEKKTRPDSQFDRYPGEDSAANRRNAYRIAYIPCLRPKLLVESKLSHLCGLCEFEIMDLSETGLGIQHDGGLGLGDALCGRILFNNGDNLYIRGSVVRCDELHASLKLDSPIPGAIVVREQRSMIAFDAAQNITAPPIAIKAR